MSTNPKPFAEWTFDDLLAWAVWEVVAGFGSGETLRDTMRRVIMATTQWRPPPPVKVK